MLLLLACAAPETDLPFAGADLVDTRLGRVELAADELRWRGAPLVRGVYAPPVLTSDLLVVAADEPVPAGEKSPAGARLLALRPAGDGWERVTLVEGGRPDRLALSPDGEVVAFVWGITGVASVWTVPTDGGPATQRTNRALVRVPGQAPAGFVPPPREPPGFAGTALAWTVDGVVHRVELP